MIRIYLFLGMIFIILHLGLITAGSISNKYITISENIAIEAPLPVVWSALTDFNGQERWLKNISALYNYNNSARQLRYTIGQATIMASQQVRVRESADAIDFIKIGQENYTELKNFGGKIQAKKLNDGSTEVTWQISYEIEQPTYRVVNKFIIYPVIDRSIRENLNSLKVYIEK